MEPTHVPVLVDEVRALLQPERGGTFVDCTVGLAGHSRMLLEAGATRLIGIDRDTDALAIARQALSEFGDRVTLVHADYREVAGVLGAQGVGEVAGVLADFGVSSMQLDSEGRGFSFRRDEPLDMRMDRTRGDSAAEMLDRVDEKELADVIYQFGEERRSRQVAHAIVMARQQGRIESTGRLAEIVRRGVAARGWQRIDPATRTFQALRIWVNRELDGLDSFIGSAAARLQIEGRIALIAFHSLEDRVVKHTLRGLSRETVNDERALAWQGPSPLEQRASAGPAREVLLKVLTKHPVIASEAEAAANPRARSAKLRAAVRFGPLSLARTSVSGTRKGEQMDKAGTFEYEIRKDFRNNQIVREVDERRLRDLWQSLGIGVVLVGVLLFSAWQHFELLRHGYRLEQMQRDRAAENDINRHLRLEMETLRAPQRIEKLATERLGMVAPGDGEAVVLERVAPQDPPARSVVAAR